MHLPLKSYVLDKNKFNLEQSVFHKYIVYVIVYVSSKIHLLYFKVMSLRPLRKTARTIEIKI